MRCDNGHVYIAATLPSNSVCFTVCTAGGHQQSPRLSDSATDASSAEEEPQPGAALLSPGGVEAADAVDQLVPAMASASITGEVAAAGTLDSWASVIQVQLHCFLLLTPLHPPISPV